MRELNIAIELWGVAFCAIGIACVILFGRADGQNRRLVLAGFAFELVAAGGDALAGFFRGGEGALAWAMTHAGNWATFSGNFLLVVVLTSYLLNRISEAGGPKYRTLRVGVHVAADVMCLLAFAGVFFTIDSANVYHRGDWYWLAQAFVISVFAVDAALALRARRELGHRTLACLLFYTLVPILAAVAQVFVYGLNFVIVAGVLALVVVFFEMQSHAAALMVRQAEELAASRVEVSDSRIRVMVAQMQPHFMFNTLDTIYGLAGEDAGAARAAIASFSRYLRTNLASLNQTEPVPVEREMEHVRTYLELERTTDPDRVAYEFDVEATGFKVPALSVQTLAENAVRHGIGAKAEGGRVTVRTRELPGEFTVTVADDGVGFDAEGLPEGGDGHIGISNTRSRLAALCDGALELYSEPDAGTRAIMRIPKAKGGKA